VEGVPGHEQGVRKLCYRYSSTRAEKQGRKKREGEKERRREGEKERRREKSFSQGERGKNAATSSTHAFCR